MRNSEEESKVTRRPKKNALTQQDRNKKRTRATPQQLEVLRRAFETNTQPTLQQREDIGQQIDMTPRSVQIWFQNTRAKVKKQQNLRSADLPGCMSSIQDFNIRTNNPIYTSYRYPNTEIPVSPSPYFMAPLPAIRTAGSYVCVYIHCVNLNIGRWTRIHSPPQSTLCIQYLPGASILSYHLRTSDNVEYRLDIPQQSICEVSLGTSDAHANVGLVKIELSSCSDIRYFRHDSEWVEQADFTEYEQASKQLRHYVKASYHDLERDMIRLYTFLPDKVKLPAPLLSPPNSANSKYSDRLEFPQLDNISRGSTEELQAPSVFQQSPSQPWSFTDQALIPLVTDDELLSPTSSYGLEPLGNCATRSDHGVSADSSFVSSAADICQLLTPHEFLDPEGTRPRSPSSIHDPEVLPDISDAATNLASHSASDVLQPGNTSTELSLDLDELALAAEYDHTEMAGADLSVLLHHRLSPSLVLHPTTCPPIGNDYEKRNNWEAAMSIEPARQSAPPTTTQSVANAEAEQITFDFEFAPDSVGLNPFQSMEDIHTILEHTTTSP